MENQQDNQQSVTGPSFHQGSNNPHPTSQTGEHIGSNVQPVRNLQLNSQTGEHIGSSVQPVTNLQSNSQTGEHLGFNVQPGTNQQLNSQTGEHHAYNYYNLQPQRNSLPNNQTVVHQGYDLQPRNQQSNRQTVRPQGYNQHHGSNRQPQRNLQSNIQTVQHHGAHSIPPNQHGTSSHQGQWLQQFGHMIPRIGNQLGYAHPHPVQQWQPMTNVSPASFQFQGGNVNPNIWNPRQQYYELIRREADMHYNIGNLYRLINDLQAQLNDHENRIRVLEAGLSNIITGTNVLPS